jgi:segregation and condensation protein B
MSHKKVLEAALFISSSPLSLDQLARLAGINSLGVVKGLMEELQKAYDGSGLEILNTPEGWVMQVRPSILPKVAHLTPYSDLGEGHKRTLALVTLKEPVKQAEIIRMQGNKAYSYIKDLKKRGLVIAEKEGHTKVLRLTQEFERYFGQEKARIKEQLERYLQSSREGEPVKKQAEEQEEPEFEEAGPRKEKARASVAEEPQEAPEEEPEQGKKGKGLKASHDHAFEEIE